VSAQGRDPCSTPAAANNPNCTNDMFDRGPCDRLADEDLPNCVSIFAPSSAAGSYDASYATFGPAPTIGGVKAPVVLVNDGSANPTWACEPLVGFPAGSIALVDRGTCLFVTKVAHAEAAGAVAVIVVNHIPGPPIVMGNAELDPGLTIPAVMVSQADGQTIKDGLPATGRVSREP
jgi:hypothetical protein